MNRLSIVVWFARRLWALPCSVLGLGMWLVCRPFGARARVVDGTLEVVLQGAGPTRTAHRRAWPFAAITLGHVIVGVNHAELARLRAHERVHVRQYERWGAAFLLAYPAASLLQLLKGRRPYQDNCFERQARAQARRRG